MKKEEGKGFWESKREKYDRRKIMGQSCKEMKRVYEDYTAQRTGNFAVHFAHIQMV